MTIRGHLAIVGTTLAVVSVTVAGASATYTTYENWKGGDSLLLTALAPTGRCDTPTLEARLSGTGIDTVGGAFAVTAWACIDLDRLRVTKLEATDRFTADPRRSKITIRSDPFTFERNDESGVIYSRGPVGFRVIKGGKGQGHYEIALSWPPSGGLPQPAHVWFEGVLRAPPIRDVSDVAG